MKIDQTLAKKVLETVDVGLCSGVGKPEPGKMCVEAAVNYAMGLPHGDEPKCVGYAVRRFKISLNDSIWSSNQARANGMRKIAIAQLGSDTIDQIMFSQKMAMGAVTKLLPELLRLRGFNEHADKCAAVKDLVEANKAARAAADAADAYAARAAAAYAARAAADAAAAYAAAAAAAYAAYARADAKDSDYFLRLSADICLEVLIEMKSPGCEFLFLCDETPASE